MREDGAAIAALDSPGPRVPGAPKAPPEGFEEFEVYDHPSRVEK
jgi:hypothetical protein